MSQFSSYNSWRAKGTNFPFADDVYTEVRTVNGVDELVGFIGVNDTSATPAQIADTRNAVWASLEMKIWTLQQLNQIAPSCMVFADATMNVFEVHSAPFGIDSYKRMTSQEYQKWIESLGGVQLANKPAPQPKYPGSMSQYSLWHYRLDYVCRCRDVDYIEIRKDGDGLAIRAFLEVTGNLEDEKHIIATANRSSSKCVFSRLSLQQTIVRFLANRFGADGFFVLHDKSLSVFYRYDVEFEFVARHTQAEFKEWLKSL